MNVGELQRYLKSNFKRVSAIPTGSNIHLDGGVSISLEDFSTALLVIIGRTYISNPVVTVGDEDIQAAAGNCYSIAAGAYSANHNIVLDDLTEEGDYIEIINALPDGGYTLTPIGQDIYFMDETVMTPIWNRGTAIQIRMIRNKLRIVN